MTRDGSCGGGGGELQNGNFHLGSVDNEKKSQRVERFKVERQFERVLLLPLVVMNGRSVYDCLNQLSGFPP